MRPEARDGTLLRQAYRILRPPTRDLGALLGLLMSQSVVSALLPLFLSQGVDRFHGWRIPVLLITGTAAVGAVTWWLNRQRVRLTRRVVADSVLRLRSQAAEAALHMRLSAFDRAGPTALLSRSTTDTELLSATAVSCADLANQTLFIMLLLPVLTVINWRLSIVTMLSAVAIFAATRFQRRLSRTTATKSLEVTEKLNTALQDALSGLQVWRAFNREEAIGRRVEASSDSYRRATVRRDLAVASAGPLLQAIVGLASAALVLFGGLAVSAGDLSLASWYLYILTLDRFWQPFAALSGLGGQLRAALAVLERTVDLIGEPHWAGIAVRQHAWSGSGPTGGNRTAVGSRGRIELRHVSMRYSPEVRALRDMSLTVPAGTSAGLVGLSGAGKSTVLKVIARLYPRDGGDVLLDGCPLTEIPIDMLRRQVAFVPQEPFLFTGTVADNIRAERPGLRDEHIRDLAYGVGGGDWLTPLADDLDTPVGEHGMRLSTGQRQIIALLRGLAKQPTIILLDEPTAALDPVSEQHVKDLLDRLRPGRTLLVVAHKLSTVTQLDHLFVVRDGMVVESGRHEDLLARGGHYARSHDQFFRVDADAHDVVDLLPEHAAGHA